MPDPIINPTTSDNPPFHNVRLLCFSRLPSPPPSPGAAPGAPIAVYPAADVDRGNNAGAKSKAEDTEYERLLRPGLLCPRFGVRPPSVSKSSSEKEILRDEGTPDTEESRDERSLCCDEARDASSRLSRGGARLRPAIVVDCRVQTGVYYYAIAD